MAYVIIDYNGFKTSTVRCGNCNTVPANYATQTYTTIGGGYQNTISGNSAVYSVIAGGGGNTILSYGGFVGGGRFNRMNPNGDYSTIGGGLCHSAFGTYSSILGT